MMPPVKNLKRTLQVAVVLLSLSAVAGIVCAVGQIESRETACDSSEFLEFAKCAEILRNRNQIDEKQLLAYLEMNKANEQRPQEPRLSRLTVLLDARGIKAYEALHIEGSINLPYTSFSPTSLAQLIPDKNTQIIIYCRNNFRLASIEDPMYIASVDVKEFERQFEGIEFRKGASVGLNVPTFITLYAYGYENVYELSTVFDPENTSLPMAGTSRFAKKK